MAVLPGAPGRPLHTLGLVAVAATFVLVLMGALVTNNEAGDSVPDWPLAYGSLVPVGHLQGGVIFEYSHRVIAGAVSALTIVLAAWTMIRDRRLGVRLLAAAAVAGLVVQALLGGIRVRLGETHSYAVATIHAFTAQLFLSLLVSLTQTLSPRWPFRDRAAAFHRSPAAPLAAATALVVLLQALLGAGFRHRVLEAAPHVVTGIGVAALAVLTRIALGRAGASPWLLRPSRLVLAALGAELLVGLAVYLLLSRFPFPEESRPVAALVVVAVIHLGAGSAVLAGSICLALRSFQSQWAR